MNAQLDANENSAHLLVLYYMCAIAVRMRDTRCMTQAVDVCQALFLCIWTKTQVRKKLRYMSKLSQFSAKLSYFSEKTQVSYKPFDDLC